MQEAKEKCQFLDLLHQGLDTHSFVELRLTKYQGALDLVSLQIRLIEIKSSLQMQFQFRYKTNDQFENFSFDEGMVQITQLLGVEWKCAALKLTDVDYSLDYSKKGKATLHKHQSKEVRQAPSKSHNREKDRFVNAHALYLKHLGISDSSGNVRAESYDKFRQIDKFLEIVDSLFRSSTLLDKNNLHVVDFGSGKSYLTFALCDYLSTRNTTPFRVEGVEYRKELVDLSNKIAGECRFEQLHFIQGSIADAPISRADLVVALHACDTATDDALLRAVSGQAKIIIVAPCCHKYVRTHIKVPADLQPIFKHGLLEERLAESLSDGLRALWLEAQGYSTKVFEFISREHTSKNTMITAVKRHSDQQTSAAYTEKIESIKSAFGLRDFYIDRCCS